MDTTPICPGCGKPLAPDAPKGLCQECLLKAGFPSGTETGGKGPRFHPSPVTELASKFPQLEILGLVGSGGMGAVYCARQKELDRVVALKILPPDVGEDPAFAERFTREAKALARLNHPNVVTLYEFGRADGLFFFLMEFVDGVNLRQLLEERRLSCREALAVVPQICDALQYAHDQGIVHRDIKPENILLDRRGRVKVADFGLAKLVAARNEPAAPRATTTETADLTQAGKVMGTPRYMAPEQVEHPGEVDHRADIYALGVVFYQMLTGELPEKRIEPPSKKVQIDVRLDEVVLRALEKKPERRYQQVSQVKTDVESIAATASATVPAPETASAAARVGQGFRRLPLSGTGRIIAAALIVVAILVGAVFLANYLPRRNRPETAGSFGPIIECVVTNMIDFDSGALADLPLPTQPGERDPARYNWINGPNGPNGPGPDQGVSWMRKHGMDAIDANHGLIGVDLLLVPLKARQWESLTRADLQQKLDSLGSVGAPATDFLPDSPGIYGFKTREGSLGIVEITDSRIPRGVKIRYKLAQPTTNAPAGQETWIYETAPVTRGPLSQVIAATGTLNPLPTDARQWRIESMVNEADVVGVETNQDVRFTLDAFPQRTFTGKVLEVGNIPIRQDNTVNYLARIAVNDPDPRFKPGMTANVAFIVAHRQNALQIPNAALRFRPASVSTLPSDLQAKEPNLCIVDVMRAGEVKLTNGVPFTIGRPEAVRIRIGISDGISTEVTEGLHAGDRVVISARRVESSPSQNLEGLKEDESGQTQGAQARSASRIDVVGAVQMIHALRGPYMAADKALIGGNDPETALVASRLLKSELEKLLVKLKGTSAEEPVAAKVAQLGLVINALETRNPAQARALFKTLNLSELELERMVQTAAAAQSSSAPASANGSPTNTSSESAVRFDPEKEVTMTEFNNRLGREALDLDTGTLFAQPRDFEEGSEAGLAQWVEHNGIDLLVDHGPRGVWGLMTTTNAELKIAPVDQRKWDRINEDELAEALAGGPAPLAALQRGILKVYVPAEGAPSPLTCAFQTSKSSRGLLQILGDSGNPPGVKIRYKLVQTGQRSSADLPSRSPISPGTGNEVLRADTVASALNQPARAAQVVAPGSERNSDALGLAESSRRNPEVLRVQIRQAEAEVARLKGMVKANLVAPHDLEVAQNKLEILKAQLDGDDVKVAQIRVKAAEKRLKRISDLFGKGLVAASDLEAAKAEVEIRQAELRAAQTAKGGGASFGPVIK